MKDISARLRELRINSGLSQERLAEQLLVSRQAVSKWENGEAMPDIENMIALARLYNTSLDSLVGLDHDNQDNDSADANANADEVTGSDAVGSKGTSAGDASDNTENASEDSESAFEDADTVIEDGNLHIHINKDGKKININLHGCENLGEDFDETDCGDLDDDHEDEDDDEFNINVGLGNIRIHEDGIDIGNGKIRIDDEGINIGKVKVGSSGICIEEDEKKSALVRVLYAIPYPIVMTVAFFLIGALANAWHVAWILFCTIPVYYSLVECIKRRRFAHFAYSIFAVCVYLFIGLQYGVWHPSWVIFLTIPIYYPVALAIDKLIDNRK